MKQANQPLSQKLNCCDLVISNASVSHVRSQTQGSNICSITSNDQCVICGPTTDQLLHHKCIISFMTWSFIKPPFVSGKRTQIFEHLFITAMPVHNAQLKHTENTVML